MIFKLFTITKTSLIAFMISMLLMFVAASLSHAQTSSDSPETVAKKYGVTFPIAQLGGCKDYTACRSFCEDPVNSSACINFAKTKGFYKDEQQDSKKAEILEKAKSALGCDSYDTCKNFCQIPTNHDKCDSFAKQASVGGGYVEDPGKKEFVEKAKSVLGCNSYASCAAFCSQESNKDKCSNFAKEVGLKGGERPVGPGGCSSEDSCKKFCSDPANYQVCSGFTSSHGGKFSGPGGCSSEDSCKSYCQVHQNECAKFSGPSGEAGFNPQEMCNRTPSCAWNNSGCQCNQSGSSDESRQRSDEYAKLCRENPTKCTPGGIGGSFSSAERLEAAKYCQENPDRCKPTYSNYSNFSGGAYDPAKECTRYSGCSWTGNSCQCGTRYQINTQGGENNPSNPNYSNTGNNMSRENQEAGCRSGGGTCNWNGDFCNCQGYRAPVPSPYNSGNYSSDAQTACKNGGGTWTGSYCQMPDNSYSNQPTPNMSRENQENGCRACGGSCNWSGDMCNCRCGSSGAPTNTSSTPAPAPTSNPQPTEQPHPTDQPPPTNPNPTTPAPSPTVQGVTVLRSLLDQLLDFFK